MRGVLDLSQKIKKYFEIQKKNRSDELCRVYQPNRYSKH